MSTEPITLVEWKVKDGDKVEKGSVVLIVETEKIQHDVEAESAGYIKILLEAGKEAPIGSEAAVIYDTQEELSGAPKGGAAPAAPAAPPAPVAKAAPAAAAPAGGSVSGTEVIVPKLGMSTEPVTLVEWKAKEGDKVEKGSVVLIVETEKIQHDVEAEASGYLHIIGEAGQAMPIGSAAGIIVASQEDLVGAAQGGAAPAPAAKAEAITPGARKLAEANMIDISKITGSGPDGSIVEKDVEAEISKKGGAPASDDFQGRVVKESLPLTGMRKAMSSHMHKSLSISAQLTVMGELDVTALVKTRKKLVEQESKLGARITFTDLFVAALARVLKEYPLVNASIIGEEIKLWDSVNVAVAVSVDDGLIVPVVRDADKKSLVEISKEIKELAQKARARKLQPQEIQGGTFTITNLGALGGGYRFETVIINQPESAIIGTGGITDRAVVRDGKVVIRPIMTYYFTYDHRVFTGATASAFVNSLDKILQDAESLLK